MIIINNPIHLTCENNIPIGTVCRYSLAKFKGNFDPN